MSTKKAPLVRIKSVKLSDSYCVELLETGTVQLKRTTFPFYNNAISITPELFKVMTSAEFLDSVAGLIDSSMALKQAKPAPEVKVTKREPEPLKIVQGDHRIDLLQAQVDSLAKGQQETIKLLQQMAAQNAPQGKILNMAE